MAEISTTKTLIVAGLVAFVCAGLVTISAVVLRPYELANIAQEKQARMTAMLRQVPGLTPLLGDAGAAALDARLVHLPTGAYVDGDAAGFDALVSARDETQSRALSTQEDIGGIGRVALHAPVFLVLDDAGEINLLVLPIYAQGYQSTIRAFLALEADLNTIAALSIYAQGETPGLGARIQTSEWQNLWPGKSLVDNTGTLQVTVTRGKATAEHEIDGITGATRSSLAVGNAVRFWLGPTGFGPYLDLLKRGETG